LPADRLGLVVIGRNEGERLARCFQSIRDISPRVYVDSGSTDGSVEFAKLNGVVVVCLEVPPAFTAARARNTGLARLIAESPEVEFVQFVDGDCEVCPGWIDAALDTLRKRPELAAVYGRRHERRPADSIYNALCDDEWNTPVGASPGFGGDVMLRVAAILEVGGYRSGMIAGEDSELSMRLRKCGWLIERIDVSMTLHDAAILHFSQWWKRSKRAGHGFGEMAFLHPDARNPNWPRTVRSILVWGAGFPIFVGGCLVLGLIQSPGWILLAAVAPALWVVKSIILTLRARRRGLRGRTALASGFLLMLGKLPEFSGVAAFHFNQARGRKSHLIEYK
jgi:glycosyltransferase involved in cell wall biosynthesis